MNKLEKDLFKAQKKLNLSLKELIDNINLLSELIASNQNRKHLSKKEFISKPLDSKKIAATQHKHQLLH